MRNHKPISHAEVNNRTRLFHPYHLTLRDIYMAQPLRCVSYGDSPEIPFRHRTYFDPFPDECYPEVQFNIYGSFTYVSVPGVGEFTITMT